MTELLATFSPKVSPCFASADDPALAGLASTPQEPVVVVGGPGGPGNVAMAAPQPGNDAAWASATVANPSAGDIWCTAVPFLSVRLKYTWPGVCLARSLPTGMRACGPVA